MVGEAWQRNLSELLDDGAIDLVCITGDIADWGKPAEFEQGSRFVEQLLDALSLSRERLVSWLRVTRSRSSGVLSVIGLPLAARGASVGIVDSDSRL